MKFSFPSFGYSFQKKTDHELLELLEQGNSKAFNVLFYRYADMLALSAFRYLKDNEEAKEMVINTLEKLRQYHNPSAINKLDSWLFGVCRNECLMVLRSRKINTPFDDEYLEETEQYLDIPTEVKKLQHLIDQELSEDQAHCIRAFYLEELTYKEIADQFNHSVKWVKSMLQNGKRKLQLAHKKSITP